MLCYNHTVIDFCALSDMDFHGIKPCCTRCYFCTQSADFSDFSFLAENCSGGTFLYRLLKPHGRKECQKENEMDAKRRNFRFGR